MFFPVSDWFVAFLLTLAVEIPTALVLLRRVEPDLLRLGLLVVFANLVTHPAIWFVITQLLTVGTPAYVVTAEAWAIGAEALFYAVAIRGTGWRRAVVVAVAANVASVAVGRLVSQSWLEVPR